MYRRTNGNLITKLFGAKSRAKSKKMKSNNTNNYNQKNNTLGNIFLIGLFLIGIMGMIYVFKGNSSSNELEIEQVSLYDLKEEKSEEETAYVSIQ